MNFLRYSMSLLFFVTLMSSVYGEEIRLIDRGGLNGEELSALAVDPSGAKGKIYLGTSKGLYVKGEKIWNLICGETCGLGQVNQIVLDSNNSDVYCVTSKGLFVLSGDKKECRNIFIRSNELEKDCMGVGILKEKFIFIGTKGGMFISKNKGKDWIKIGSPFEAKKTVSIYCGDSVVYAATESDVYKSVDNGKSWEKILNLYFFKEPVPEDDSQLTESREESKQSISYLTGTLEGLYVVSNKGIFLTKDSGKGWQKFPVEGLDTFSLKYLFVNNPEGRMFAITKSGLFELKNRRWKTVVLAYDSRQIAQNKTSIIFITSRDIFKYDLCKEMEEDQLSKSGDPDSTAAFKNEPTIEEVQEMAINYAEVSDKKIKDWRRKASVKAILPELSVDFDSNVATSLGATYERCYVGPADWGVSLKWNLANIIYNSDQTTIDNRSKLMVELRNDVLAEVTRLYFERRKLQIQLASKKNSGLDVSLDDKMRLLELTALLDRLTGSQFSRVLKSR